MKYPALIVCFTLFLFACSADIGDSCTYDVECSANMDRTCDNGQPGGYCLIITCAPDGCPGEAACVEFTTPSPDFADSDEYDDVEALYAQIEPNRTRTYCLKHCKKDSDCRSDYHCAIDDELELDLNGVNLDSKGTDRGVCVPDIELQP